MSEHRVCMLVHSHYQRDTRVRKEAECLAAEGFSVDVISLREPRSFRINHDSYPKIMRGICIHEVNLSKKRGGASRYFFEYGAMLLIGGWKILRMHLKNKFDVIHIHNMPDFLVLAGIIPKLTGAKLILDIHDPMVELYQSMMSKGDHWLFIKALAWQEKFCCWLADRVVSVNVTMRENLEHKGIPKDKIFIVNNFPDSNMFPLKKDIASWPKRENCLTLLFTGTVTDHYDLGVAVKALALASHEITDLVLRIVGEGNKKEEILCIAKELGIVDRIVFCGSVPADKVREEMKQADVGISSHKAGIFGDLYFSTKIIEFMTQGLPVICSRTYTIEKYVPENAIFYFEPGNHEDMARQIITIWRDHELVKEKIEAAMRLIPALSWGAEKVKFAAFYKSLVRIGKGYQKE